MNSRNNYMFSNKNLNRLRLYNEERQYKFTDEEFAEAVRSSSSKTEIAHKLGFRSNHHVLIVDTIKRLNLSLSHFKRPSGKWQLEDVLVENSPWTHTGHLKSKLIANNLKKSICEQCGITSWLGQPLSLALHHRNGMYKDNRLENLQLLCPNCHSQTPNYGHKNKGNGRPR